MLCSQMRVGNGDIWITGDVMTMALPLLDTRAMGHSGRHRRKMPRRRSVRCLCAALAFGVALVARVGADKAAYSLDLIGITSGTAYTVVVNVGTTSSANSFRLIADTGSSNDALLGTGCCGADPAVTFSCDASSTCKALSSQASLEFAGASITGSYVTDVWSSSQFGSLTKDFLVINEQESFYRSEYDGITGLAYKALAQPKDAPKTSFYENLVASKSATPDTLGLLLCGVMQPLLTTPLTTDFQYHAGQMLVGGTDGTNGEIYYKEPILYTPIAQEAWYVVIVTDIGFDGKSLGLPCSSYNQPQAIIDSGTSNMAFPSDVYNALMTLIKAATQKSIPDFSDSYFDFRKTCCGKDYCNPTDATITLLSLPSIYITLALQEDGASDTTSHYTVEIPPEYYFRPEINGINADTPCRAMGIAESTAIVLGDVFMDGLFAYHDRPNGKLGLAVADNCPNGVKSNKKITKTPAKTDDWCDCFSDTLQSKSTLARYVPWGKGCFFMPWWLYVVLASVLVVLVCIGVLLYWYWTGRRAKRRAIAATTMMPNESSLRPVDPPRAKTPAPSREVTRDYAMMHSPRDLADSNASSIALLTSSEDFARDARRAQAAQQQQQQQQQHVNQYGSRHHTPSRKPTGGDRPPSEGFLL